ncbi:hypothetical protein CRI63_04265 [Escherichia sp. E2661]|nr:hypothetical protein CRI63_04265 [Escherichia sp. E2661]
MSIYLTMKARKHISSLSLEQVNLFFIYKEYYFLTLRKIVRLYEPGNYQTSNALLPKKQRITDSPENET